MTKAQKIVLFEIDQYDSDINGSELKEENHFLLHLKDKSAVVFPQKLV